MSAGKVVSGPGETGALVEDVVEGAVWVVSLTVTHTSGMWSPPHSGRVWTHSRAQAANICLRASARW